MTEHEHAAAGSSKMQKSSKDATTKDKELALALVYKDKLEAAEGQVLALTKEVSDGRRLMAARNQAVEALLDEWLGDGV